MPDRNVHAGLLGNLPAKAAVEGLTGVWLAAGEVSLPGIDLVV